MINENLSEQASTRVIFASNSTKGQILRALINWMEPFDTPIISHALLSINIPYDYINVFVLMKYILTYASWLFATPSSVLRACSYPWSLHSVVRMTRIRDTASHYRSAALIASGCFHGVFNFADFTAIYLWRKVHKLFDFLQIFRKGNVLLPYSHVSLGIFKIWRKKSRYGYNCPELVATDVRKLNLNKTSMILDLNSPQIADWFAFYQLEFLIVSCVCVRLG